MLDWANMVELAYIADLPIRLVRMADSLGIEPRSAGFSDLVSEAR